MRVKRSTFLGLLLLPALGAAAPTTVPAKVALYCEVTALTPGKAVTLGAHFKLEKGWHIYWRNPGDSGQAPRLKWDLPPGFKAGETLWPAPQRLPSSHLMDHGYEGEVMLLVPLQVPSDLKKGQEVRISLKLDWLVCREVCLPGNASLSLTLGVKDRRMGGAMKTRALFQKTRAALPLPLPEDARVTALLGPKELTLSLEARGTFTGASFLPAQPGLVENAAEQGFKLLENGFQLTLKRSGGSSRNVETLEGVLLTSSGKEAPRAYTVSTKLYNVR